MAKAEGLEAGAEPLPRPKLEAARTMAALPCRRRPGTSSQIQQGATPETTTPTVAAPNALPPAALQTNPSQQIHRTSSPAAAAAAASTAPPRSHHTIVEQPRRERARDG